MKKDSEEALIFNRDALAYHAEPRPGKYAILPTKDMNTQRDLSLAYSPGVAQPCLEIAQNPALAYKYTNKGNMVAVISNGTAVLGLGNIGAVASKPVMEGKSVLFNKFAGVESIDICIDAQTKEEVINCVKCLGPSFAGINLEDIKGPDCFYVENKLKEIMDIPIFHDDQHGTAIVCLAGLINAMEINQKSFKDIKIVCIGAGAAGIACLNLIINYGANPKNIFLCDTKGVCYKGRKHGMNEFKDKLAVETDARTFREACVGADVLIGVSAPGMFDEQILKSLNDKPIIFAMSNPEPECRPELAKRIRPDCIIATGRSDYPNQINNVMCFPFLFRATLDVRAKQINEEMKMAAAIALANLAKQPVPDSVKKAIPGRDFTFGREYVIPTPFDPRLIFELPVAIAKAAMESGIATEFIQDFDEYRRQLAKRMGVPVYYPPSQNSVAKL